MDTPQEEYVGGGEWQVYPYRWSEDEIWSDPDFEVTHWLPLSVKPKYIEKSRGDFGPPTKRMRLFSVQSKLREALRQIEEVTEDPVDSDVGVRAEFLIKSISDFKLVVRKKIRLEPNPFSSHECLVCGDPATHCINDTDDVPVENRWCLGNEGPSWYFCDEHGNPVDE